LFYGQKRRLHVIISAMKTLSGIANRIIDFIYPPYCGVCRKPLPESDGTDVCGACIRQIKRHPKPDCRAAKSSFSAASSVCLYEGALKDLIHLFKYKNKRSLAGLFARYMIDFVKDEAAFSEGIDMVTFVPLHIKRRRERDFNQSEALGRLIAEELNVPAAECLEKIKQTASQNELSRRERLNNLKGAFRVRRRSAELLQGRTLLLIDDVMTTGATLDECSRTLLEAGAAEVRCLTLARGI
jgi:competence protein ComFC